MPEESQSLIKKERMPTLWCPGCTIGIIFFQMVEVMKEKEMTKDKNIDSV